MTSKRLGRWPYVLLALVLTLLSAFLLSSCGSDKPDASSVSLDETITGSEWQITLTELPEKENVVGEAGVTYQAKGVYLIVYLQVSNLADETRLFPPDLAKVTDAQGQEFITTSSTPQFAYIQTQPQRGLELLIDSPVPAGATRNTFLMFDIPTDSEGLSLVMDSAEGALELGY